MWRKSSSRASRSIRGRSQEPDTQARCRSERGCTDDRGAHLIEVDAACGEIHQGVGAVFHCQLQLLHLLSGIRSIRRGADVGVHLALAGDADRHRLQIGVVDVGRDDHSPPSHFFHHQRLGQVLLGHMGHSSVTTPVGRNASERRWPDPYGTQPRKRA